MHVQNKIIYRLLSSKGCVSRYAATFGLTTHCYISVRQYIVCRKSITNSIAVRVAVLRSPPPEGGGFPLSPHRPRVHRRARDINVRRRHR